MPYFPQGLKAINKIKTNKAESRGKHIHKTKNVGKNNCLNSDTKYVTKFTGYPKNVLKFNNDKQKLHPCQKPLALMEYLIKTYTLENQTVIDMFMGSGTTGVACKNINRSFIGIERDEKFFNMAEIRLNEKINELKI